jgi:XTP/dITP diphosphohydrolase
VRGVARAGGRTILVATHSSHKAAELSSLLDLPAVQLVSLDALGITSEPVEDATSFRGNAVLKARYYADLSGLPTIADDSGLEVDALGGGPGVRTRRYAGEHATDEQNNAKLLRELRHVPPELRTARYRCVLAFVDPARPADPPLTRLGTFPGRIARQPRGAGGFGYDPIFLPHGEPPGGRTVGQLSQQRKNQISHRARAARAMARALRDRGW